MSDVPFSTYTRLLVSDWRALNKLLAEFTRPVKEMHDEDSDESRDDTDMPKAISPTTLQDAFDGPYHAFFQTKFDAYAKLTRLRMELNIRENDIFKGQRGALDDIPAPSKKLIESTTLTKLDDIYQALDELTQVHADQIRSIIHEWNGLLLESLRNNEIELSILELSEFQTLEPMSELRDRYTHFKLKMARSKNDMSFNEFFQLRIRLIILNALSRQHQVPDEKDITAILKKMKSTFDAIKKQEQALFSQQKSETSEVLKDIS